MQEKPPFSSYFDFFSLLIGGGHPLPYHPPAYFDFALRHAPWHFIDFWPLDALFGHGYTYLHVHNLAG